MVDQNKAKLVVIVDDDDSMRSAVQDLLEAVGFPARGFASAEEFLKSGQQHQTACLIADIRMPGMSGLELQARLNAEHCRIPTIFITAHGDTKMRMQVLRAGAVEFLAKPFDDEALLGSVRAVLAPRVIQDGGRPAPQRGGGNILGAGQLANAERSRCEVGSENSRARAA